MSNIEFARPINGQEFTVVGNTCDKPLMIGLFTIHIYVQNTKGAYSSHLCLW